MKLTCDEVQELLWPLDRPREYTDREEEARAHLRECEGCRGFFARDAIVARLLRRLGLTARAPDSLRGRVSDVLAHERARGGAGSGASARRRGRTRALVAAAVVTVAVGLSTLSIWNLGRNGDGAAYVEDFMSRAVEQDVVQSPAPEEVSSLFMREMGVQVIPVAVEEAKLSKAMICLIKGELAAMVEYDVQGQTVAHYRIPIDRSLMGRNGQLHTGSERGVQVARWTDAEFEHALVSELPAPDLEELARTVFASR